MHQNATLCGNGLSVQLVSLGPLVRAALDSLSSFIIAEVSLGKTLKSPSLVLVIYEPSP